MLEEYDIQIIEDIQKVLKDLLGGIIKEMVEVETREHLEYEKSECSNNEDARNDYKYKSVNSSYSSMEIAILQDGKDFVVDLETIY